MLVWLCYTPLFLFANVQKGRKVVCLVSILQDTFLPSSKRGRFLKGGACSTQVKMVLMMSKAMHHVHHWFRISPDFLACTLDVVDQALHIKEA